MVRRQGDSRSASLRSPASAALRLLAFPLTPNHPHQLGLPASAGRRGLHPQEVPDGKQGWRGLRRARGRRGAQGPHAGGDDLGALLEPVCARAGGRSGCVRVGRHARRALLLPAGSARRAVVRGRHRGGRGSGRARGDRRRPPRPAPPRAACGRARVRVPVMASAQDVYETTTAAIVEAIEAGAESWSMPWARDGLAFPINATTQKHYRGGNVLALMAAAITAGWSCGQWATFKQWQSIGTQVRKGERGTGCLFWTVKEDRMT
ncbi:MAG: DUF1738 domain-containing protein, partial [Acidimicrobiia bacterium]|nr:DUF1738 domain-containing protein [Acidimicrobiia bacterium]